MSSTIKQAALSVQFLVIGAGIAGLTSAIALRRAGHHILLLEREGGTLPIRGAIRMPPNMTKVLYKWGLKDQLSKVSIASDTVQLISFETGELYGKHRWDKELLEEAGGDFLLIHYDDLLRILRETATSLGAELRYSAPVATVDAAKCEVTLLSGETLRGDIVIGADGLDGICRQHFLKLQPQSLQASQSQSKWKPRAGSVRAGDPSDWSGYTTLFANIPASQMKVHPELHFLLTDSATSMSVWLGSRRSVIAFPAGPDGDYSCLSMVKTGEGDALPPQEYLLASIAETGNLLSGAEPRLSKLVSLVEPFKFPIDRYANLVSWSAPSSPSPFAAASSPASSPALSPFFVPRSSSPLAYSSTSQAKATGPSMLLIGEAAHPLARGCHQHPCMAMEDAAVLGRLFSHLSSKQQIPSFLHALQEIREPRCIKVSMIDWENIFYMCMTPAEGREQRDETFRAKTSRGEGVFDYSSEAMVNGGAEEDSRMRERWEANMDVWGYEVEDEADAWWVQWGLIEERKGRRMTLTVDDVVGVVSDFKVDITVETQDGRKGQDRFADDSESN